MDDSLNYLLEVEAAAEKKVDEAAAESERIIQQAMQESAREEARFKNSLPALRMDLIQQAEERAARNLEELSRRYTERAEQLRRSARQNEQETLRAALELLLETDS